jgi:hypothetical protein
MLHLAELCHHMNMRRSHLLVLTVLVLSAALLPAQMAGGESQGGGSHGVGGSGTGGRMPGHGTRRGSSNGFFPLRSGGHHNRGYGAVWFPYGAPYWDEDGNFWDEPSYQQPPTTTSPQVIVVENKEPRPPAAPPEPPKLIEVPQSKEAPAAKPQLPTVFVLKGGERLESRDYLLTAESLQIQVGRQRREIPLGTLDLDATIAANHQRGIELTIPRDRSAVFVSF